MYPVTLLPDPSRTLRYYLHASRSGNCVFYQKYLEIAVHLSLFPACIFQIRILQLIYFTVNSPSCCAQSLFYFTSRLSLPTGLRLACRRLAEWPADLTTISEPRGSDKLYLSDKIMMLHIHRRESL
jgi:hypothetical protein